MTLWRYSVILSLAGGITFGLGLIMKAVVTTEFAPQSTDIKNPTSAKYVEEPPTCDCASEIDSLRPRRDIYLPVSAPARLEPDESCHLEYWKPKAFVIPDINMSYIWGLEPKRAKALEVAREKAAVESLKDPCPLVSISVPRD